MLLLVEGMLNKDLVGKLMDLLDLERKLMGRVFTAPYRPLIAAFAQPVLDGTNKLLLRSQVKHVTRTRNYPECSRDYLVQISTDRSVLVRHKK